MVRVGQWKMTFQPTTNGPLYALFNLNADPTCQHDVAAAHPDITRELQRRLMEWLSADGAIGRKPTTSEIAAAKEA